MRRSGRTRRFVPVLGCLLGLAIAGLSPLAHASRVRPVNLEEMTARAARILQGECTEAKIVHDPDLDRDVATITLRVERSLKGNDGGETVTFRMLLGADGSDPGSGVAGLPRIAEGERVILFLYGESRAGLTSPVGLGQGRFTIVADKQGGESALSGFGNRMLFQRLSPAARSRIGNQSARWKGRDGIPPAVLLDLVESLTPGAAGRSGLTHRSRDEPR